LAGMASMLVTEDPRFSSPGLAFLLSEIAVSEKILDVDWQSWWTTVKDDINVQEGWSDAWYVWTITDSRSMLVSYGTDPAYAAFYSGEAPDTAVSLFHYDDQDYAWMQIEGMGLVKGGPHPELAKAFIEYCLTADVQEHIPLNQWMFPANLDVEFDPAFQYALHPDEVHLLNTVLPQAEIAANLTTWLDEWESIRTG
jgi:thiamine transport system substrate-binding protein